MIKIKLFAYKWFLDFGVLKLLIGILICSLILQEINQYVNVKPTTSSFSETEMIPEFNPLILICKTPAYDIKKLYK